MSGLKMIKVLGQGSFGKVFLTNKGDQQVAVKDINNDEDGITDPIEIDTMARIDHPNIIHLIEGQYFLASVYLIMPVGIPLDQYKFPYPKSFIRDLVSGVTYLHNHKLYHCDLKNLNMIVIDDRLVVIDFSLTRNEWSEALCGQTISSSPPEILYQRFYKQSSYFIEHYSIFTQKSDKVRSDYWATGVCIIYLLTMKQAFWTGTEAGLMYNVNKYLRNPEEYIRSLVFDELWIQPLLQLMNPEVMKRSTIETIAIVAPLNDGKFKELERPKTIDEKYIVSYNEVSEFMFRTASASQWSNNTYIAAIDLFLRYITASPFNMKLAGITSMFLMEKFIGEALPVVRTLVRKIGKIYTDDDILIMEIRIVKQMKGMLFPLDILEKANNRVILDYIKVQDYIKEFWK